MSLQKWCVFFLSGSPSHPTLRPAVCISFLLLSNSALLFLCCNHPFVPVLSQVFPPWSNSVSPLIFSGFLVCLYFTSLFLLGWRHRHHCVHNVKSIRGTPLPNYMLSPYFLQPPSVSFPLLYHVCDEWHALVNSTNIQEKKSNTTIKEGVNSPPTDINGLLLLCADHIQ